MLNIAWQMKTEQGVSCGVAESGYPHGFSHRDRLFTHGLNRPERSAVALIAPPVHLTVNPLVPRPRAAHRTP